MHQKLSQTLKLLCQKATKLTTDEGVYDVAIVGGGMIGSSLAIALSALALKVVVIEPYPQTSELAPGFDARAIALSWGSMRIFKSLVLDKLIEEIATPISSIHVSDKGHLGITRLKAKQLNVSALGQVVELADMGKILFKALAKTNTKQYCPAKVVEMQLQDGYRGLSIELDCLDSSTKSTLDLKAKLVVAADGNQSAIRAMAGIETTSKPYEQVAIISTLESQLAHNNVAFERFTESGPVAFLPLSSNRISMVWMVDKTVSEALLEVDEAEFISQLQRQFGYRLGRITRLGKRFSYPLNLVTANSCTQSRLVLLGNAAQSLHPIAGQGFNLGIRDIACLGDVLRKALLENIDLGSAELLEEYVLSRSSDKSQVINFTDAAARLFANPSKLLSVPRNTALIMMNFIPELRSHLAEAAMGIGGRQSRLVRGLPLTLNRRYN